MSLDLVYQQKQWKLIEFTLLPASKSCMSIPHWHPKLAAKESTSVKWLPVSEIKEGTAKEVRIEAEHLLATSSQDSVEGLRFIWLYGTLWCLRTRDEDSVAGHIQMRTGKGKSVSDL